MDMHRDSEQISRLEVIDTGRRRRWRLEEKVRIVEESLSGYRQASTTARRYGIPNSLLFKWRKAYREGRLVGIGAPRGFVPAVVVADEDGVGLARDGARPALARPAWAGAGRMEVVTATGQRIIVGADVDAVVLARVVAALEAQ
jgi:transposase